MRAARLHPGGDLVVEELKVAKPREGDALVRVNAAAITRDELTWPIAEHGKKEKVVLRVV